MEVTTSEEDPDERRDHFGNRDGHRRDDVSGSTSKMSEYEEDNVFEPELDFEPDDAKDTGVDDHIGSSGNVDKDVDCDKAVKGESFLSDDDDIEVIDVINNERCIISDFNNKEEKKVQSSKNHQVHDEGNEGKVVNSRSLSTSLQSHSRSGSLRLSDASSERSGRSVGSVDGSSKTSTRKCDGMERKRDKKYTKEDLMKVKAFFSENRSRSKRKEVERNSFPAKKVKGNDGREYRAGDDYSIRKKLEREGKNFIPNYIPYPSRQDSNFKADIKHAFKCELNDDILTTLTPKYCGLCFKDFPDDVVAWKHYTGPAHKGTISRFNRGSYKGHPPFWKMVHERLCKKDRDLTEKEIFEEICEKYNVGENKEKVEYLVMKNIDYLLQYKQIGQSGRGYFVKNRNAREVEKYFNERKIVEESVRGRVDRLSSGTYRKSKEKSFDRRSHEHPSSHRDGRSNTAYPPRKSLPYSEGKEMLVVDPARLRLLPNGQIMIKPDDVMSMRPRGQI